MKLIAYHISKTTTGRQYTYEEYRKETTHSILKGVVKKAFKYKKDHFTPGYTVRYNKKLKRVEVFAWGNPVPDIILKEEKNG